MRFFLIAAAGLALVACSPPGADKAIQPAAPAPAQVDAPLVTLPPLGENPRDALIGCAAVVAAKANIDTAAKEPSGPDTPDSAFYWTLMALLDKEAMPPEAKQAAIEALKKIWGGASSGELDARLGECRARFAPQ